MGKTFGKVPFVIDRKDLLTKKRNKLKELGIENPTYTDVIDILLHKDNMITLNRHDLKKILQKNRGIFSL